MTKRATSITLLRILFLEPLETGFGRREIGNEFVCRRFDGLALNETKLKRKGACKFEITIIRNSGVEVGYDSE